MILQNDRERIVNAFDKQTNWREITNTLGVNLRTAFEWIRKIKNFKN